MYASKPLLLLTVLLAASGSLLAEEPQGPAADPPVDPPIIVESDSGRLEVQTGAYLLTDNVKIERGTLSVFADEARSFSGADGQIERIELDGAPTRWEDVLEDGSPVRGQSDQILYDFTANLITMRGNARIENSQGQFSGSQLVYDLDTQNLVGDGGVRLRIEPATAASAGQALEQDREDLNREDLNRDNLNRDNQAAEPEATEEPPAGSGEASVDNGSGRSLP